MEIPAIDMHVMIWVNQLRSNFLDVFFTTVTWAGSLFVLLPLTVILTGFLLAYGKKKLSIFWGWALCVTNFSEPENQGTTR
jgi:hypothetical protein